MGWIPAGRRPRVWDLPVGGDNLSPREAGGVTPGAARGDTGVPEGVTSVSPKPKELTPPRTTPTTNPREGDDAFDAFWATYPRREGKDAARRCWVRAVHRLRAAGLDAEAVILTGAARCRDDPNRRAPFTAHPSTWLHGGRWDDDPLPPRGGADGRAAYSDPPAASYDDGWTLPPEGPTP